MKKYLRSFSIVHDGVKADKAINKMLEKRKATAEDVISVTTYNLDSFPGIFRKYTIWYKSEKK